MISEKPSIKMESHSETKRTTVNELIEHFGIGKFQAYNIGSMSFIKMADGVEVLTLSFMGIVLGCSWNISSTDSAVMISCVFVGMIIGGPLFGNLADRYGRKPILILASSMVLLFALLSCAAPTFVWFCFMRLVMGCGIGGNTSIASSIVSEISPTPFRAKTQSIAHLSWSIGTLITVGVAALVLPYLGWRWFLFFASVPLLGAVISLMFINESIRFLVVSGQKERAMEVIKKFSRMNKVAMPTTPIDLSSNLTSHSTGDITLPFSKRYRHLSILQFLNWFAGGMMYYGVVIFSSNMPAISYSCLQNSSQVFHSILGNDDSCCKPLNNAFYASIAISSIGDMISTFVDAYLLDVAGRKLGIAICAIVSGIGFLVLDFCMPILMRSIVFSIVRCFTASFVVGWYIFTLELYPTSIRNSGLGMCQFFSRSGAAVTSFSSMVLLRYNTRLALFIYVGLAFAATILTLCIPVETNNVPMEDGAPIDENGNILTSNVKKYASLGLSNKEK